MSVAKSYAKAFYETAKESGQPAEPLERELEKFIQAIASSRDAQIALHGPVTSGKEKVGLVGALCQKMGLSRPTANFLELLARKERLSILSDIYESLSEVRLLAEGGVSGKLVSAEAISAADVESLALAFGKKLNRKVAFRVSTDPTLLAGMKVTVNGVTYDGTLRSQLQRLRDQVAAGVNQ